MSAETLRLPPLLRTLSESTIRRDLSRRFQPLLCSSNRFFLGKKSLFDPCQIQLRKKLGEAASLQELDGAPVAVELELVCSESQFDRIVAEAQQLEEPLIIVWMASWCRKCIYLKPKLEKLAADYYPRLRFYCVNVNSVPHRLIARAGVTKMPTIQLWRDGKKEAEVIGGHKAHLVVSEVREMIGSESNA